MAFIETPINNRSLGQRKLVCGVGLNDSEYMIATTIKGKQFRCHYYETWANMFMRCYSEKYQHNRPSYKNCTVCDEWLVFSVFKSWMKKQDWKGKSLDKDILIKDNKIYSPESCSFVSTKENTIMARAKHHEFISPCGFLTKIYNLSEFCRVNSLDRNKMGRVGRGELISYSGWSSSKNKKSHK